MSVPLPPNALACLCLVLLLSWMGFGLALADSRNRMGAAFKGGPVPQDLSAAYFLHGYHPRKLAMFLTDRGRCLGPEKIVYDLGGVDGYSFYEHLGHSGIRFTSDSSEARQALRKNGCLCAVTRGMPPKTQALELQDRPLHMVDLGFGEGLYHAFRIEPAGPQP